MKSRSVTDFSPPNKRSQSSVCMELIPCLSCPLCGKEGRQLHEGLEDWLFGVPGRWGIRECSDCEVAWPDLQPVAEDIPKLYSRYYTHRSLPSTLFANLRRAASQCVIGRMGYPVECCREILPRLLSYVPSIERAGALDVMGLAPDKMGTLLDVGCGNGEFIERMRALGWSVTGVDPDRAAVEWGRSQGVEVFHGTVSDVPVSMRYDAITLNHVLEHVADPRGLLRECRKRLRPSTGTMVITTPNIKSLGHWWFKGCWRGLEVPRHLLLFSPDALSDCIAGAGLCLRSIRTETRLARMIYSPSVYAKKGSRNVGERVNFNLSTKCASYAFQLLEDALIQFKKDIGEEIYCVCTAPAENDGKRK